MRIAVGTDIIRVSRGRELIRAGGLERLLSPAEINRSTPEHIAGLIALKEAAVKALGLTADDWLNITIRHIDGRPSIDLNEFPDSIESIDCSISHDGEYAVAVVSVLYRQ